MFDDMFHDMFVSRYVCDQIRYVSRYACVFHVMVGDRLPEISFLLNQAETRGKNSDECKRRRSKGVNVSSYVRAPRQRKTYEMAGVVVHHKVTW